MQSFNFDVTAELFNVVIVWNDPCGGIPKRASKVANVYPLDWATANKWCHDILHGIGRDWQDSKYTDIYIEPANCPRPWTPEILEAFRNEMKREVEKSAQEVADERAIAAMRAALNDCKAAQGFEAVGFMA